MKPLNLSDNPDDDEQTLSFLPRLDPPIQITVSNTKSKNNSKQNLTLNRQQRRKERRKEQRRNRYYNKQKGFCLPWMVEAILFMIIIFGVVLMKALYRQKRSNELDDYNSHIREWNINSDDTTSRSNSTEVDVDTYRDGHLKLDDIQQWCLNPGPNITKCQFCSNPLAPMQRYGHSTWTFAYHQNVNAARKANNGLDVVFLGDSILEGFKGTSFGKYVRHKQDNIQVYDHLFDTEKGGDFDGLVLAIAGDKSPNLLWRIQNGEFPNNLSPKVFWVLIGTNDFLKDDYEHCSEEVILMGIKRVVGEILYRRPEAIIVINGILPRANKMMEGRLYHDESDDNNKKKTVMNAIDNVNRQLKEFSNRHENLHYFDAKEIFIDTKEETGDVGHIDIDKEVSTEFIPQSFMVDYIHPTALGYQNWGLKIVEELHTLIDGNLTVS